MADSLTSSQAQSFDLAEEFSKLIRTKPDVALAVAAITCLTEKIKHTKAKTFVELVTELDDASKTLQTTVDSIRDVSSLNRRSTISLQSGCDLFRRFVIKLDRDLQDFEDCKKILIERGEAFSKMSAQSRYKVAALFDPFFRDQMVILLHGYSRVSLLSLLEAAKHKKRFSVICTESRPDAEGYKTARILEEAGIPVRLIADCAVAHVMDQVDFVLVGAEGVVENGGIINKIGTYQLAIIANARKKPFYVATESFKFVRQSIVGQAEVPCVKCEQETFPPIVGGMEEIPRGVLAENHIIDYTPPNLITLLFTDIGIFTPSAVSDELIKLYY